MVKTKKSGSRETDHSAPPGNLSRRRFAQLAMLGLAGGALMPAEILFAGEAADPHEPAAQETASLPPRAQAEVDAKLKAIFAEYGDRLSAEQKKRMKAIVSNHVQMLESVRSFPVHNPDAPATVLKLVTGDENRTTSAKKRAARARAGKASRRARQGAE
jgi:hypothetical protein